MGASRPYQTSRTFKSATNFPFSGVLEFCGIIAHRSKQNYSADASATFSSPICCFLASSRMARDKQFLCASLPCETYRTLDIVYAIGKPLVCGAVPNSFIFAGRSTCYFVVAPVIENEDGSLLVHNRIGNCDLAEHRTSEAVYPYHRQLS